MQRPHRPADRTSKRSAGESAASSARRHVGPKDGDDHRFVHSDEGGGGIRRNDPPVGPGSIPYVHVSEARAAYDKALREGAQEMVPPTRVMEGVTVAIVRAPGGVPIGFSGP